MVVISVYTYGVKIIKKFRWESGFLWGGFHGTPPPLCTNGSAGYLMQLSVNVSITKNVPNSRDIKLITFCSENRFRTNVPVEHTLFHVNGIDIVQSDYVLNQEDSISSNFTAMGYDYIIL